MLWVRLQVNSRLFVKSLESQKLYMDFLLCEGIGTPTPTLLMGQLYYKRNMWSW